jgi:hypothetical protein
MFVESLQGDLRVEQVDFQSVRPLLLILGNGIILTIFVFVVEIIINKISRKLTRRNARIKAMKRHLRNFKVSTRFAKRMQPGMQHEWYKN